MQVSCVMRGILISSIMVILSHSAAPTFTKSRTRTRPTAGLWDIIKERGWLRFAGKMDRKDYYKLLGVNENAGHEDIKKAYRNLAFRYHPDRNPGNEDRMKEINEAYAVLSDPVKKREYNTFRQTYGSFARDRFRQTHTDQDIFRDSDIDQILQELSRIFGFSSAHDILGRNDFYGSRYRTFEFKGPGLSRGVFFSFGQFGRQYHQGARRDWSHRRSKLTLKFFELFQKMAARKLGIDLPEKGRDLHDSIRIPMAAASQGEKVRYSHKNSGVARELLIKVPAGIRDGQKIKLKGLGGEGKNGGEAGDLYLKITISTPLLNKIKRIFGKGF